MTCSHLTANVSQSQAMAYSYIEFSPFLSRSLWSLLGEAGTAPSHNSFKKNYKIEEGRELRSPPKSRAEVCLSR